ncbi:MAG: glycosyl transferase, partial [Clostridia bacterium]|nr:glycosyl transferase [Clostridia bacterium]
VLINADKGRIFTREGEIFPDSAIRKRISEIVCDAYASRGVLDKKGRHIIDLKKYTVGPHYSVNLLLGDRTGCYEPLFTTPKSAVDEFGRGSFRAGGARQVLATRYTINVGENGEPVNRQFYVTENGKQIFYSANANDNVKKAYCIHSVNKTEIVYYTYCGLKIKRTIFILPQEKGNPCAVEIQKVEIKNTLNRARTLKITFTGAFGISPPMTTVNDVVYANVVHQSELFYKEGKPVAAAINYKDENLQNFKQFAAVFSCGDAFDEYCFDNNEFFGKGNLYYPEGLSKLPCRHNTKNAWFFALAKNVEIPPCESAEIISAAGISEAYGGDPSEVFNAEIGAFIEKLSLSGYVDKALKRAESKIKAYNSHVTPLTGDSAFNAYVKNNLPFQVLYQTFVSRSFAWTQKAYRETGFREIQDIYASMSYMVASGKRRLVAELISKWAENVFEMGYAYHDFTWVGKEPGDCSDDQLWLVQAVYRYVNASGDYGFLRRKFRVAGCQKKRRLIDTLKEILRYSGKISVGAHGLPLLDKADWNDTLRMDKTVLKGPAKEAAYNRQLSENGQEYGVPFENSMSESVMNACLLKIAADETCEMASKIGEQETAFFAREIAKDTEKSLNENCWKDNFYARVLINDERRGNYPYVGAKGDGLALEHGKSGTYFLNCFSWPILAGVADEEKISDMIAVLEKELKCVAGFKLCTLVAFDKLFDSTGTSLYFPGDRENGGVFKHAEMMAVTAMLKAAKKVGNVKLREKLVELATYALDKTYPYKTMENPFITKGNPRFCTQYNNSITGENIGPILSGTASWLTLAVREFFGITETAEKINVEPVLLKTAEPLEYSVKAGRTRLHVKIESESGERVITEKAKITVNGKEQPSASIDKDGGIYDISIKL